MVEQARQLAEQAGLGRRGDVTPAEPYTPSLESSTPRSLESFAFQFGIHSPLQSSSGKSFVLDLPDAPLVSPAQPAVSGGPIRLDPPHEDVPLRVIDGVGEGKNPENEQEEEPTLPIYLSPYEMPNVQNVTKDYINSLPRTSTAKTPKLTLKQYTVGLGIPYTRAMNSMSKEELVNYLWTQTQNRQSSSSSSSS
jgi:hypothetical protein